MQPAASWRSSPRSGRHSASSRVGCSLSCRIALHRYLFRRSERDADVSLLNRGTDQVTVFADVIKTDSDGNTITAPGTVGVLPRAVVQPLSSTEDDEGTSRSIAFGSSDTPVSSSH